jgi:hypothetical protein
MQPDDFLDRNETRDGSEVQIKKCNLAIFSEENGAQIAFLF